MTLQRVVRMASWVLTFAAIGAVVAGWAALVRTPPSLDDDEAIDVALGALDEVGLDGTAEKPVELIEHEPDGGDPIDAWAVFVDVDGEVIELRVQEDAGQLVYVDDNTGDGRLLTDDQFDVIGSYQDDSVLRRAVISQVAASAAAAIIAAVGYTIARRSSRLWRPDP